MIKRTTLLFLVGCGGAPFTMIGPPPDAEFDAGPIPPMDAPGVGAAPDADRSDRFTVGKPDAGREAEVGAPDVEPEAEAGADADVGVVDAGPPPADAPHETKPPLDSCAAPAPFTFGCGTNQATVYAPGQYCVDTNAGTSYQGTPMPMPTQCTCDYSCRCLLAFTVLPCQGRTYNGCTDAGGVAIGCQ
jgi:hypothetical protein